jgi:hypothetical protein
VFETSSPYSSSSNTKRLNIVKPNMQGRPTEEATMRCGTARALAALPLPAGAVLSPSPSRPRGVVEAAAKERDAVGRSAQDGRRMVPARGGAVLARADMVSILYHESVRGESRAQHATFGLGEQHKGALPSNSQEANPPVTPKFSDSNYCVPTKFFFLIAYFSLFLIMETKIFKLLHFLAYSLIN